MYVSARLASDGRFASESRIMRSARHLLLKAVMDSFLPHCNRSNASFVFVISPCGTNAAVIVDRKAAQVIDVRVSRGRLYVAQTPASPVIVRTAYIGQRDDSVSGRPS